MQNMKRMKANQAHKWPVPERIELLYRTMADVLGPTGWWPAAFRPAPYSANR